MHNLTRHVQDRVTPQTEPIPGREAEMKPNNAGGFTFVLDDWKRLDRFLVLGTEGGTYYATERKHTKQAFDSLLRCVAADGVRVVKRIVEISDKGRAPKNDYAILALAACMKKGNDATRAAAFEALPSVARIGTHLFHLAEAIQAFGGWGRGTKRAFGNWYQKKEVGALEYQLVKYQSRDKWSHRDILRLAKPTGHERGGDLDKLLRWATHGDGVEALSVDSIVYGFELAKKAETPKDSIKLIEKYRLPRECVRTEHLNSPEVWEALLATMPIHAMVRNLGKMASIGMLTGTSDATKEIVNRLEDEKALRKSRLHPFNVLVALTTYAQGRGVKGSNVWSPVAAINGALDAAFYKCFDNIVPTGKRWYYGIDISGSMDSGEIAGLPGVTPRMGAAAMAMVSARTEPWHEAWGFTANGGYWGGGAAHRTLTAIDIGKQRSLADVCNQMRGMPMGGTDCSQPMVDALARKVKVDTFVVLTDNETWAGAIQPVQALRNYRQAMGIDARLIVVGMTGTEFTIADPADAGMLDCVGADTATPQIMADFTRGDL